MPAGDEEFINLVANNSCNNTYLAIMTLQARQNITGSFTFGVEYATLYYSDATSYDEENLQFSSTINLASSTPTPPAPTTHTVTYDYATNGGTSITPAITQYDIAKDATVYAKKEDANTPQASKTEYTFVGWNINANATTGMDNFKMEDRDVTLYAIFKKEITANFVYYNQSTRLTDSQQLYMYNNETKVTVTMPPITQTYKDSNNRTWTRKGWTKETSSNPTIITTDEISSTQTYYMVYERTLNVAYNTNGGSAITATFPTMSAVANSNDISNIQGTSSLGADITTQTTTKAGYTFKNKWNTKSDGSGTTYLSGQKNVTFIDDTTLYAVFEPKTYTFKYKVFDGTNTTETTYSYVYENNGAAGVTLPTPTRDGYTLKGWATTPTATTAEFINNIPNSAIVSNANNSNEITLYTVWEAGTVNYTVKHYKEELNGNYTEASSQTKSGTAGNTVTLTSADAIDIEGHTFDSSESSNILNSTINGDGSTVLKMYYKLKKYTVTFKNEDGTVLDTQTAKYGQGVTYGGQTPTKEADNKYIYTFTGWKIGNAVIAGEITKDIIIANADNNNEIIAVAQFSQEGQTYTIRYNGNGNTNTSVTMADKTYTYGQGGVQIDQVLFERAGYGFKGWTTNSTETTNIEYTDRATVADADLLTKSVNKELKLYAVWEAGAVNYTIKHYKENLDGTYVEANSQTKSGTAGNTVTLTSADAVEIEGQTFDVSNSNNVLSGTIDGNGNTVLKMYYKLKKYTVTFKNEDGTVLDTQTAKYGQGVTYGGQTPTKAADDRYTYTFTGWKIGNAEIAGEITKDIIIANADNNNEIIAVAQFSQEGQTYTIRYNGNGNTNTSVTMTDKTYIYGTPEGLKLDTNEYVKTGYGFKGWTTNSTETTNIEYTDKATIADADLLTKSVNKELKLYAVWEAGAVSYTIKHYKENLDETYAEVNSQTQIGTAGNTVTLTSADAVEIEGHTFDLSDSRNVLSDTINGNGSTILKMYYKLNTYDVKFYNEGTQIGETQPVKYGGAATAPADPSKAADNRYTYTFTGWDKAFNNVTGALDVNAVYEAVGQTYTIKYYGNGNTNTSVTMEDKTYTYGQGGVQLDQRLYERTGYGFKGWTTNSTETTNIEYTDRATIADADLLTKSVNKELKLYAVWEAGVQNYIIEYYKQKVEGGYDLEETDSSNSGSVGTEVQAPEKSYAGYEFDGSVAGTATSGIIPATGTLTLKLYYKLKDYTVTFKPNGSNATISQTSKDVTYKFPYGALPTASRTGYIFEGWYDAQNGGNKIEPETIFERTSNQDLYAHWNKEEYEVKFIGKDANGNDGCVLATVMVPYKESITSAFLAANGIDINDLKKDVNTDQYHYVFEKFEGNLTNVTEPREILIQYTSQTNQYKIIFYNEDGTIKLGESTPVDYGTDASDSGIAHEKVSDETYNYVFDNWYNSTDSTATIDNLTNVIEDRTVYAKYTPQYINYEVKFLDDQGNEISKKEDYHYNNDLVLPQNPTKNPTDQYTYEFLGWYDASDSNENIINLTNVKVTENKIYKAKFGKTTNQYTVTFNTGIDGKDDVQTVDYGTDASYSKNINELTYKENGYKYTFSKWVTEENGNVEATLSNITGPKTVYAAYTAEPIIYTITYEDTNGATNTNPTTYTINSGTINLDPLGPKEGMTFVGWYTDRNYTDEVTSIDSSRMEKIVLYAKWDIDKLMYFVKLSATVSDTDLSVITYRSESSAQITRLADGTAILIYYDFDDAKAFVDNLFNEGNGTALGIFDLNDDLVYWPEVHPKYYVKANENDPGDEYTDFDIAKTFVDGEFANGTTLKIYDEKGKLVYEPKAEAPKVQYFVKENWSDPNTPENTFNLFSSSKVKADKLFANGSKVKVYDINGEIVYEPDDLYLKSDLYKIGKDSNLIHEYEEGDMYIYRVNPNTTLAEFKDTYCDTNGTITVYKKSGTILGDSELVGTGMTLIDERNGKTIRVVISVKGDIDGNGLVTITDFTAVNQHILQEITLEGAEYLAADVNDDNNVSISDFTIINQTILQEFDLASIN